MKPWVLFVPVRHRNSTGLLVDNSPNSVRCFDPAGQDDIGGGCGQLWYVQSWMKENEHLTRKSVGANLPKAHTPV